MNIFLRIIKYFETEGQRLTISGKQNELEQMVGTFGWAGQRFDTLYQNEHGETPAEERLRKFKEDHYSL